MIEIIICRLENETIEENTYDMTDENHNSKLEDSSSLPRIGR